MVSLQHKHVKLTETRVSLAEPSVASRLLSLVSKAVVVNIKFYLENS